ncbi:uncharacterized protein LOC115210211 isoform X1 [Octopus sinensis]|uniref:Uncharacterized protein LOC115210211 isoform X1 n=1 Tax=Octopus sinensis TaxID=2607531 RepID=A0A7E6F4J8_9MOLL|nr:uncharacterized protein LOC115210211 isoform X1 [Octopus sinensis]XP_036362473.1 uncharacterized protein LOC115210211 isoform X1 [Octopus sinensis]
MQQSTRENTQSTMECLFPGNIRNGYIITKSPYYPGSYITFTCSSGFFMVGSPFMKCSVKSTWIGSLPRCVSLDLSTKFNLNSSDITLVPRWLLIALFTILGFFLMILMILLFYYYCCRKTSSTFVPRRFKLNEERIKHHLRQDASKKETKSSKCNIPDPKNGSNSLSNNKSNNKECRRQYCAKSLSNSINSSTVSLESTPIITKQMVERGTMACMPHLYTISMEKSQARRKDHIILKDHNGHCVGYAIPLDTRKWVAESRDEHERNSSMSSIISYDQNNIDKHEQQIVKTSHITNSTPSYTDHGPHRLKPTVLYIHSDIHQKNIRNSRLNPNTRHRKGVTKEYTFNQGWGMLPQAKKLTGWIPHSRPMRNNNTSTQ